jgi:hypothetical protein
MRFSEKIYNKYNRVVSTSSDICEFKYPQFTSVGMDIINEGLTAESPNVFIIEDDIDISIDITFINNLDSLVEGTKFNYYILQFDKANEKFKSEGVYVSPVFDYVDTNYSGKVNTGSLLGEGEYIFKMGYQYDVCTEIANKLGKRHVSTTFNKSLPYGNYDENNDKYFVVLYKADEPLLDSGISEDNVNGGSQNTNNSKLTISSLLVEHNVSDYPINVEADGDILVSWNGSILSAGQDYTISNGSIQFFEPLDRDDLVNLIYVGKSNTRGTKTKSFKVVAPIAEGVTGEEGVNDIYYNTDTNKYELYVDYKISNSDSFVVMLNGQVLANQIDYFVSTSNPKRVILSGGIYNDDMITVIYDSGENLMRGITTDYLDINWYVNKNIVDDSGEFVVELAKDKSFIEIEQAEIVPYVIGQVNYTKRLSLNYDYGQVLYYRVRNIKKYTTISADELNTENVSEIIRIEIKTNISNNY